MRYWLIKSEPAAYGWEDLVRDGHTVWEGVRNHRAAGNLRAMQVGEQAFYYHSVTGKEIVGIVEVTRTGFADPTDAEANWPAIEIRPVRAIARPVTLKDIKAEPELAQCELVRLSRLSVAEISVEERARICAMSVG